MAQANHEPTAGGDAERPPPDAGPTQATIGEGSGPYQTTLASDPSLPRPPADAATVLTDRVGPRPPIVGSGHDDDGEALPERLGGVRLLRRLGKGGMGTVHLGHHETMDLQVAVKIITRQGQAAEGRFLQECRTAARIQHPNVIRIFHAGEEAGRLYLVMELVEGGDVADLIDLKGRLDWREAVRVVHQAALGLGAAHAAGIVHRDVKPGNLMLGNDGSVKVADLGLAKEHACDIELTQTGAVMGTPAYMAPEQAMDVKTAGPAADVYSLGVTLWVLLSGELPFKGTTSTQVIMAHINDPVPDLRTLVADVPQPVIDLLAQMLAKTPDQRPKDGNALAAALEPLLLGDPTLAPAPAARSWRPALVLAAVAVLSVAGLLAMGPGADGDDPPAGGITANDQDAAAAAAAEPVPEPLAGVVRPAWQTPPRQVVLLLGDADPGYEPGAFEALFASGLAVVEREQIAHALKEVEMTTGGLIDQATAVRVGKVLGAHLAIFARAAGEAALLRATMIETTEILAAGTASDPVSAATTVASLLNQAVPKMPLRGWLEPLDDGHRLTVGRRHGVAVGDRFAILDGPAGAPVAVATVTDVSTTQATVTVAGQVPAEAAPVERQAP